MPRNTGPEWRASSAWGRRAAAWRSLKAASSASVEKRGGETRGAVASLGASSGALRELADAHLTA